MIPRASLQTQIQRLRNHWLVCRTGYNEVALLDLAATLRIIGEAHAEVAHLLTERGVASLPHASLPKAIKKIARNSEYWALLLPGGVHAGIMEASTTVMIARELTDAEELQMAKATHRHIAGESLPPERWFGAEVVVASRPTSGRPERLGLSRIGAIKRVANTLGGSHYSSDATDSENRFDWVVERLLAVDLLGVPAPYLLMMKIAQDLLFALDGDIATFAAVPRSIPHNHGSRKLQPFVRLHRGPKKTAPESAR